MAALVRAGDLAGLPGCRSGRVAGLVDGSRAGGAAPWPLLKPGDLAGIAGLVDGLPGRWPM
ncbi:hypothetical protein [Actinoplanes nipponensis]|uniref:Uncharacterized protein n=1 Tax=Actinoplanes nipponensis TaxID=135950 RepID=A0A919JG61_9ACTN|nr:hypothetical protein [Actinoplanes nipponensis]GIE50158.1 hypothetical protein Ani05nite_36920 [Actinoplanes nipponensis]